MKINFNKKNLPLPISDELITTLEKSFNNSKLTISKLDDIIFNFRDDSYDPERGGYHPVEIRIVRNNDHWQFDYITDFCYVGSGFNAELTKNIDFDFTNNIGFHLYAGEYKLSLLSELFEIWQSNFIDYVELDIFTVEISTT